MTNISERKTAPWVWNILVALCVYETLKLLIKNIWLWVKILTSLSEGGENVIFLIFISSFPSIYVVYLFMYISLMLWSEKSNSKQKMFATAHQKNMKNSSKEHATWKSFQFWPVKNISKNYEPRLQHVYQIIKNNCCSRLFTKFVQTQKKYPTFLDKLSILTRRIFVISSQNVCCERNSSRTNLLWNISYLLLRL